MPVVVVGRAARSPAAGRRAATCRSATPSGTSYAHGSPHPATGLSPPQGAPAPAGRRREPTAAQWRAVGDALEKFCGRGRWAGFAPVAATLPDFEIAWVDPANPPAGFDVGRAAASTAVFAGGHVRVSVRLDLDDAELHRAVLHELQHVLDEPMLRAGWPDHVLEQRARDTAARLAHL